MDSGPLSLAVPELGLLASAIAGTTVRLERSPKPTHARGRSIVLGPEASSLDVTALRRLVVAQGTLIAVGSLREERARALVGQRSEIVQGYLGLEIVRAAGVLGHGLPRSYVRAVTAYGDAVGFVAASAAESLELALTRPIALPPEWFGRIFPREATRSAAELGAGEPPSASELSKRLTPDQEPAEDLPVGERSALLEKLSGHLSSPLARGSAPVLHERSSPGDGVARMAGAKQVIGVAGFDDAGIVDGREIAGHALVDRRRFGTVHWR